MKTRKSGGSRRSPLRGPTRPGKPTPSTDPSPSRTRQGSRPAQRQGAQRGDEAVREDADRRDRPRSQGAKSGPARGPRTEGGDGGFRKERPYQGRRTDGQRPQGQQGPRRAQGDRPRVQDPDIVAEAAPGPTPGTGKHNLLYGLHPVAAALVNPRRTIRGLYLTEAALEALDPAFERAHELELDRPEPTLLDKDALEKLLPPGAVHQGVALDAAPLPWVAIEDVIDEAAHDPTALVIVLDQVTDPHNVGAIMRSAAAFGARAVIVQDRHAPPVTGVLAKTASGAVDAVPLVRVTNLARAIDQLKQASFWTVGLAEAGERPLHAVDLSGRTAIVLGSEGEGMRRLTGERCDEIAKLPTQGPIGSLNVSNAAAVALYEVARRR